MPQFITTVNKCEGRQVRGRGEKSNSGLDSTNEASEKAALSPASCVGQRWSLLCVLVGNTGKRWKRSSSRSHLKQTENYPNIYALRHMLRGAICHGFPCFIHHWINTEWCVSICHPQRHMESGPFAHIFTRFAYACLTVCVSCMDALQCVDLCKNRITLADRNLAVCACPF